MEIDALSTVFNIEPCCVCVCASVWECNRNIRVYIHVTPGEKEGILRKSIQKIIHVNI